MKQFSSAVFFSLTFVSVLATADSDSTPGSHYGNASAHKSDHATFSTQSTIASELTSTSENTFSPIFSSETVDPTIIADDQLCETADSITDDFNETLPTAHDIEEGIDEESINGETDTTGNLSDVSDEAVFQSAAENNGDEDTKSLQNQSPSEKDYRSDDIDSILLSGSTQNVGYVSMLMILVAVF